MEEYDTVVDRANENKELIHFGRLHELCFEKNPELPDGHDRRQSRRVVADLWAELQCLIVRGNAAHRLAQQSFAWWRRQSGRRLSSVLSPNIWRLGLLHGGVLLSAVELRRRTVPILPRKLRRQIQGVD